MGVVLRQRLNDKLTLGLYQKLTLISAPAGFGKTTLTLSWLKQLEHPVSWISLDTQDSNPARFFTYLANALSQSNPQLREYFTEKMNSQVTGTVKNMAEILLNEVSALSPFTVIVLDDYHCITDQKIHDAMSYLLQNLHNNHSTEIAPTQGCHFIILTRSDPPFPISRWRLENEITEIRANDLRFSLTETEQIFSQSVRGNLTNSDITVLSERTEGWAAGLQMVATSLHGLEKDKYSQYIKQIKGDDHLIADYLIEEVLSQLDKVTQSFLLQTSILERMCGSLCDAVTQKSGSQNILQSLEKKNILITPLDNNRGWYRYHQLFGDVLLTRLMNESDCSIEELHSRAAQWFEKNGIIEDSLKHWLRINRFDEAARIIAEISPKMMSNAQYFLLINIIESFSDEAFQIYPWLSIYLAWAYTFTEPESVETWLLLAENVLGKSSTRKMYPHTEIKEMYGDVATIKALVASRKGDFVTVARYAPIALKLLPKEKKKVRGLVLFTIATDQYIASLLDQAVATYAEAYELLLQDRNLAGCEIVSVKMNQILLSEGKLHDAEKAIKQAISLDQFYPGIELSMSCCLCALYGKLLFEWNQINDALKFVQIGLKKSKMVGSSERAFVASIAAEIWLGLGEIEKAEQIVNEYIHLIGDPTITLWDENHLIASWMAVLAVKGKKKEFLQLGRKEHATLQGSVNAINEPVLMAYVYSNFALHEYKKAIEFGESLEQALESSGRTGSQIRVLSILVASRLAMGDSKLVFPALEKCIRLGAQEGYIRSFLMFGEPMMDAISTLQHSENRSADGMDSDFLADLQDEFLTDRYLHEIQVGSKPRQKPELTLDGKNFTNHELKILRLLIAGYNNKEISLEMCISVNTVKTHLANIYGKLGVHNRFQASVRVRQLGLNLHQ